MTAKKARQTAAPFWYIERIRSVSARFPKIKAGQIVFGPPHIEDLAEVQLHFSFRLKKRYPIAVTKPCSENDIQLMSAG